MTYLLGSAIGSSAAAFEKTRDLVDRFIPRFSKVILNEVLTITELKKTLGIFNFLILLWSMTPLVSSLRNIFKGIFRTGTRKPFFIEKIKDILRILIILLFFMVMSTAAVAGLFLKIAKSIPVLDAIPGYVELLAPLLFLVIVIFFLYSLFFPGVRFRHLLAGSLTTAFLWLVMGPAFNLFLSYNPGYGYAFGSLKSIFIIMIWIYYSQCVFLFGAEFTAALDRQEAILIRSVIEGKRGLPRAGRKHYLISHVKGSVIFHEGDNSVDMYYVLEGSVSIQREGREIAVIPRGKYFGEMAFLLREKRVASAVALEDTDLIIINTRNMDALMKEFPEIIIDMLREVASRLRETDKLLD
jgi:YihY family inner membrane protein